MTYKVQSSVQNIIYLMHR